MKPFINKNKVRKKEFSKGGPRSRPEGKFFSKSGDRPSRFEGGERERPEIFKTICAKCGKEAIVPFKPLGNKPILCQLCFVKKPAFDQGHDRPEHRGGSHDRFDSRPKSSAGPSSDQFEMINRKLDRIIKALEID